MATKTKNKFSLEVRSRAVRMVLDQEEKHPSRWAAVQSIAAKVGCSAHTLLDWVKKNEVDNGTRTGMPNEVPQRMTALQREVRQLRQANKLLRKSSVFLTTRTDGVRGSTLLRQNSTAARHIREKLNVTHENLRISNKVRRQNNHKLHVINEVRRQMKDNNNRLRRVEVYVLNLMKQTGVALETLAVKASDSQHPATREDVGFIKLEITKGSLIKNVNCIRALTDLQCRDVEFLEHALMPELGLADEDWSFPPEIAHLSGKGLHLIQLPCQVAPFLAWLADNARGTKTYLEIGVRWGGMFILVSEWLKRFSPELCQIIALDPAEMSPLIREYADFIRKTEGFDKLEVRYVREYSTSAAAKDMLLNLKPDFVFIDGDHSYEGVSHDYELVRDQAKMLIFHDICSRTWPGVGRLWHELVEQNAGTHAVIEFTKQYQSGDGGGMGLGVIKKLIRFGENLFQ